MNKEDVKAVISTNIYNCVTIVSFTGLAITVDKWWVVLFALLFVKTFSYKSSNDVNKD